MENYLKDYVIGRGAYGTVYKVKCLRTGKAFALKYHTRGVDDSTVRELSCLAALRGHPYVIHMHDCFLDNGKIAMLMPYVPYTVSDVIHNGQGWKVYKQGRSLQLIPLSFVAHFSVQVATALSYMHGLNIVHRDLTPSNVLLTEDLTVKVADMGLSRQSSKWMSPTVVTEPYRAPELFVKGDCAEYTCAIDMWSLGVMIAEAMEGKVVFLERANRREKVSTHQIILRTLCPKDHPRAPITPWDPVTLLPQVMECELVKRIVFRLLAFRDTERLMAHELLQDTEWSKVAHMTEEDKGMVRGQIEENRRMDVSKEV
ncbi:cyclin-dependent kinase 2-like [Coregonus clupeaformis]|uniref:cyclin-dependent kinase 2-like n=1 Tax=Coregonus clupeaformis TaxID=59861 RepID=UPI001E1C33AD|nr:cyclin-dependent kinase 2-like [Coregonus clupeaformis]